jgi:hypothetical protein
VNGDDARPAFGTPLPGGVHWMFRGPV